jgi:hypothetical protein
MLRMDEEHALPLVQVDIIQMELTAINVTPIVQFAMAPANMTVSHAQLMATSFIIPQMIPQMQIQLDSVSTNVLMELTIQTLTDAISMVILNINFSFKHFPRCVH